MTRNLRISLTVLSIGFAFEGVGEVYTRYFAGPESPGVTLLYILPLVLTALGLLFVWVGRTEWNEVHRVRVRRANQVFAASLLGGVVAGLLLALLYFVPSVGTPAWAEAVFGAAVASLVFGTFVTYAFLVFHLVSLPGKVVVTLSLLWALAVSVTVAVVLASTLPTVLGILQNPTPSLPAFVAPVDYLISYLFVSYFLLLVAYVDAHVAVARGLVLVSNRPGVPVTRVAGPKAP